MKQSFLVMHLASAAVSAQDNPKKHTRQPAARGVSDKNARGQDIILSAFALLLVSLPCPAIVWAQEPMHKPLPAGVFKDHPQNEVAAIAFAPDGRLLAVAGWEEKPCVVQLRDIKTGPVVVTLDGHKSRINAVIFSPGPD